MSYDDPENGKIVAEEVPKKRSRPGRPSKKETSGESDSSRERLLTTAIKIFALHGYQAVSTNQIAKEAGMAQSMVHYHFRTKERLWKSAIDHLMRDLGKRFPIARDELKDLDPVSQLKVIFRRFVIMSANDVSLSRIIAHEGTVPNDRLSWLVQTYLEAGFGDFDKAVAAGIEAGLIKDLPVYAVTQTFISAASYTFCLAPLVQEVHGVDLRTQESIDELSDTILEMIFGGIIK